MTHAAKVNPDQNLVDEYIANGGVVTKIKGQNHVPKNLTLRSGNHQKPRKYVTDAAEAAIRRRNKAEE